MRERKIILFSNHAQWKWLLLQRFVLIKNKSQRVKENYRLLKDTAISKVETSLLDFIYYQSVKMWFYLKCE